MTMVNLKQETLACLKNLKISKDDIIQVQWEKDDEVFGTTFDNFLENADVFYDNGFGIEEVETSLVLLVKDGSWFTRESYDGSEWWEYHKTPNVITNKEYVKPIKVYDIFLESDIEAQGL